MFLASGNQKKNNLLLLFIWKMAGVDQEVKSRITLKGSAKLVAEFFGKTISYYNIHWFILKDCKSIIESPMSS